MSNRALRLGDAVRVYMDDIHVYGTKKARKTIGFIRFIGFIPSLKSDSLHSFTQYVGVELLQPTKNGHDGKIHNTQYFNVEKGYGIHVPIVNVIEVLTTYSLMMELKNVLSVLQVKNNYIKDLESQQIYAQYPINDAMAMFVPDIDVNLPPSHRNTFFLPGPITPVSSRASTTKHNLNISNRASPNFNVAKRASANFNNNSNFNTSFNNNYNNNFDSDYPPKSPSSLSSRISSSSSVPSSSECSSENSSDRVLVTPETDLYNRYIDSKIAETYKMDSTPRSRSSISLHGFKSPRKLVHKQSSFDVRRRNSLKAKNRKKRFKLGKTPVPEVRNNHSFYKKK